MIEKELPVFQPGEEIYRAPEELLNPSSRSIQSITFYLALAFAVELQELVASSALRLYLLVLVVLLVVSCSWDILL